ncbi:MAG TPA: hypothetical protein VJM82_07665 [Nitrospiraceae bacterium]|nr:hypothetical protein [Nitrospiraceae bacterium]
MLLFSGNKLASLLLVERGQETYKQIRPQSALGYRPPTPETTATRPISFDASLTQGVA